MYKRPSDFYKWEMVLFLWMAHFFNQADRQVFNVLLGDIRETITMTEVQAGLIGSAFLLVYGILTPIAGFIGDFISRKWIIVCALFFWSLATVLTGSLAVGFVGLLILRSMATGAGEAFYYPSANAMMGQYHEKTRATAMSIHQSALYIGIIFSSGISGWIGMHYGWQMAFKVFGFLGILLAVVLLFRFRNDKRDREMAALEKAGVNAEAETAVVLPKKKITLGKILYTIFSRPTILGLWIGLATFNVVGLAFMQWMPTILRQDFQLDTMSAGLIGTTPCFAFAILGVLCGGWFSDKLAQTNRRARILVEACSLFLCAPFIFMIAYSIWMAHPVAPATADSPVAVAAAEAPAAEATASAEAPAAAETPAAEEAPASAEQPAQETAEAVATAETEATAEAAATAEAEKPAAEAKAPEYTMFTTPHFAALMLCIIGMALYGFFRGAYDSNLFACMFDFIPQEVRSSASGLLLSVGAIVGAIGPTAIPVLKEWYGTGTAMAIMAGIIAVGGVVIALVMTLFFSRDYYEAEPAEELKSEN